MLLTDISCKIMKIVKEKIILLRTAWWRNSSGVSASGRQAGRLIMPIELDGKDKDYFISLFIRKYHWYLNYCWWHPMVERLKQYPRYDTIKLCTALSITWYATYIIRTIDVTVGTGSRSDFIISGQYWCLRVRADVSNAVSMKAIRWHHK